MVRVRFTFTMEDDVGLSRKREKQLKRLRGNANDLWQQQQEVLEQARDVMKEAREQLGLLAQEELAPRVKDVLETRVRPGVQRSVETGRELAGSARDKLIDDVLPSVAAIIGSTLSMIDMARQRPLKPMMDDLAKKGAAAMKKSSVPVPEPKKGMGAGSVIGIGLAAAATVGVVYAVWQTFRADDELWIAEDEPEA